MPIDVHWIENMGFIFLSMLLTGDIGFFLTECMTRALMFSNVIGGGMNFLNATNTLHKKILHECHQHCEILHLFGKGASLKFTIALSSPIAIVPNSFVAKESSGSSYCFSTPPL